MVGFIFLLEFQICNSFVHMLSVREDMINQISPILLRPLYTGAKLPEFREIPDAAISSDACCVSWPISGNLRVS